MLPGDAWQQSKFEFVCVSELIVWIHLYWILIGDCHFRNGVGDIHTLEQHPTQLEAFK